MERLFSATSLRLRVGRLAAVAVAAVFLGSAGPATATSDTVATIQDRGLLQCGVTRSGEGLSETDEMGEWQGFFPDFCRALAAAVLGDPEAVDWVEVDFVTRFDAIRDHAFDVLVATTTWTLRRDVVLDLAFTQTLLYDGQAFLAHEDLGVERLSDLPSGSVCVHDNTTTIANLREVVRTAQPQLSVVSFQSDIMGMDAFFSRQCDLLTMDRTALIAQRASRGTAPEHYVLLEDVISREPLGPAVRQDDTEWFEVVQWLVFALIVAEEHGVTSQTLDDPDLLQIPEVARLLGAEGEMGQMLGLSDDWARAAIAAVGNYGEMYARNLGMESSLQVPRGLNDLWRRGGLLYAPPLR